MTDTHFIVEVTEASFAEAVVERSHELPVLVDFWAEWCAPCKMLMPILAKLVADYQGKFLLAKVDTDQEQRLAGQWQVRSLPSVKLFVNGAVVEEFMGVQAEPVIRAMLDKYIERASDVQARQARVLLDQGNGDAALALLRDAIAADTDNDRLPPLLIQAQLQLGKHQEAEETLRNLPLNKQTDPEIEALAARVNFALGAQNSPGKVALLERIQQDDTDLEARYLLASHYATEEDYEAALVLLLEILRHDKTYREGKTKESIIDIFNMLGSKHPLVSKYRPQMAKILM